MSITPTGNAEIDQQHELLEAMVGKLSSLCEGDEGIPGTGCANCSDDRQQRCRVTLTGLVGELGAFLVAHSTYEERMMDLLPPTPTCLEHVRAHKAAHLGVARQLGKLAAKVGASHPREASVEIMRTIGAWLGDHSSIFDNRLIRLSRSSSTMLDFDGELVAMLDQHVFPNRPTVERAGKVGTPQQHAGRMEVRGRIESLTPGQKKVFWLVVGGKKNREIAEALGITLNTVKTHRAAIFSKMNVSSVVELVKKTDMLR